MRFDYTLFFESDGTPVERPCGLVRFMDAPDVIPQLALLDSGADNSAVPIAMLDVLKPAEHVGTLAELGIGGTKDRDVPVYKLSLELVCDGWSPVALPDVNVAFTKVKIPFLILGASALQHTVVLNRPYDRLVHVKSLEVFQESRHHSDGAF
jgi:hypothetical protein